MSGKMSDSIIETRNQNGRLHSYYGLPSVVTKTHIYFHNDGVPTIGMKYSKRVVVEGIVLKVGGDSAGTSAPAMSIDGPRSRSAPPHRRPGTPRRRPGTPKA